MVQQIGFYGNGDDERLFIESVAAEGAQFMPSCYPEWPIPCLQLPLPAPSTPYMAAITIWYPDVFSEAEMRLPENRAFNEAGGFYLTSLWPVLEYCRPSPSVRPVNLGTLRLDATCTSFRIGKKLHDLSAGDIRQFEQRLAELQRLYRRLCSWVRRNFVRVSRRQYCGNSILSEMPQLRE